MYSFVPGICAAGNRRGSSTRSKRPSVCWASSLDGFAVEGDKEYSDEEIDRMLEKAEMAGLDRGDKYQLKIYEGDPIADALRQKCNCREVLEFELLDSRWNGNEVFRAKTSRGDFFVKMNRVEDVSVFMSEAVGLATMAKTQTVRCPLPLHVGKLPKVGSFGPGAFMILEWYPLVPFGASRPETQKDLGQRLARMHLSNALDDVHKGRFGFMVNNFLSLTPMDNRWINHWPKFITRRIALLIRSLFESKAYAHAPLQKTDENKELLIMGQKLVDNMDDYFQGVEVRPSLLHGDLWIGNIGATKEHSLVYDPACFFGHHELDLAIMDMFGGFTSAFFDAYREVLPESPGFADRAKLYKLYHFLNQLNLFGNEDVKSQVVKLLSELTENKKLSPQSMTILEKRDQVPDG
eukprot:Plantae.Rhodophyta-Purpureofilum_apyrenoidigerum.ctg574.p1 GENE.Plantae.Rhodophyta-Purpureofilum_apyrenoidigerum.ctg574~~Plantae.Rhodophyta-Purpureofilum_apyrenoidigerum.ctg574.p1  ORF type:complete len:407 (+),score=63.80 Plantae.Rhodophyta-Purpureofilum_apyrenoidigerum.ctg574:331-1551(+)